MKEQAKVVTTSCPRHNFLQPGYTCNGSPTGCNGEQFGGCKFHESGRFALLECTCESEANAKADSIRSAQPGCPHDGIVAGCENCARKNSHSKQSEPEPRSVSIPQSLATRLLEFLNRRMERDRWQNDQCSLREAIEDCQNPDRERPDEYCGFCHGTGKTFNSKDEYTGACFCVKPAYKHPSSVVLRSALAASPSPVRPEYVNVSHSQECALRYITAEDAKLRDYGCTCKKASPSQPESQGARDIDEQFAGMKTDEAYRTEALKLAGEKPFLRFERDPNNGANLHAVFFGDRPLHHFRADQNVTQYMADIQRNLDEYLRLAAHNGDAK